MNLKIAILGTRGVPNHYGGYEQAASFLSGGLVAKGHSVTVYNSHNHPYTGKEWLGAEIVRCYDPEHKAGTAGQFIYDLNCLRHARKRNYDVLLLLGYTSSSIWGRFYPKKTVIISNMDGLEWKRAKYTATVRRYLQYAEKLAVQFSDYYIADSLAIRDYLQEKYRIESRFIPYGAVIPTHVMTMPEKYKVGPNGYYLLIARIEPENNIETILEGWVKSGAEKVFIVVGNLRNKYGKKIYKQFRSQKNIRFTGSLFDQQELECLKKFCSLYFHGHSVGGTNPSLLEAMASEATVAAHDNPFNRAVLGEDAFYFQSAADIANIIQTAACHENPGRMVTNNLEKIKNLYTWEKVIDQYEDFILECYHAGKK